MKRREFLQVAAAATAAAGCGQVSADEPSQGSGKPAVSVERLESDHFRLQFSPAIPRPLKILQLTDTHFGNPDPLSKLQDKRSFEGIQRLVKHEQPDFLVHTGDFINNDKGAKVSFEAIDVLDDLGIPWTHALGNHDIGARSVPEFRRGMKRAAVGEFRAEGGDHYAYKFDVVAAGKDAPAWQVYCFDSGFREPGRKVSPAQLEWFGRQMRRDIEQHIEVPALAMIHIPVVEFETMRAASKQQGNYGERVCFDNDSGDTFAVFKRSGRIKAVFSGHDHKNDYHGLWDGIELVYGRVGGWSAYGDLPRGGRLIEIDLATGGYSHRLVFPQA